MVEIEMKFRVSDYSSLVEKLNRAGVKLGRSESQKDIIFVSEDTVGFSIKPGMPVVRIRSERGRTSLALKKRITSEKSVEHELDISDEGEMTQILANLGLKKIVEVVKQREITCVGRLTYCLDVVDGLGCFLEIETMTEENEDITETRKEIMFHAAKLGLGEDDVEKSKYDTLIYNVNEIR